MAPEILAALHLRAFDGQRRAWKAPEFAQLLSSPQVWVFGDEKAFGLGRVVVDEAELLTLVCDPDHRRKGLARDRLGRFESEAAHRGVDRLFLEVSSDNHAALCLYASADFAKIGRRAGYYKNPHGRVDAIVMEKRLT